MLFVGNIEYEYFHSPLLPQIYISFSPCGLSPVLYVSKQYVNTFYYTFGQCAVNVSTATPIFYSIIIVASIFPNTISINTFLFPCCNYNEIEKKTHSVCHFPFGRSILSNFSLFHFLSMLYALWCHTNVERFFNFSIAYIRHPIVRESVGKCEM